MASFNIAYKISRNNEGGYANDPRDEGGETYKGVSRNANPRWAGWKIVDAYKAKHGAIKRNFVIPDPKLDQLVLDLFKANYWNKIKGDSINSQNIANIMFDFALTSNYDKSAINAQRSVGVTADGIIGSDSLKAINKADEKTLAAEILKRNLDYYTGLATGKNKEKYEWAFESWKKRISYFTSIVDKIPGGTAGAGVGVLLLGVGLFFLARKAFK